MASDSHEVPNDVLQLLKSRLSRGELALFTGAGFSHDAVATDGRPLPSVDELRSILWPIAFGADPVDEQSPLADVFECALQQSPDATQREMERCLRVDSSALSEIYKTWFTVPWKRVYTLNIDDLDEAVARRFELPSDPLILSYLDPVPATAAQTWFVHLNGRLDEFPNVTFSAPQYAERLPGRDPWYATLAADLVGSSFVFVGSTLDEPPLWQHVLLRGERSRGRELRPRSFLVTPHLAAARRRLLNQLNIEWIPMSSAEFADGVLSGLDEQIQAGQLALRDRQANARLQPAVVSVSQLREAPPLPNAGQYLLGREPTWRDITDGYAVLRDFESEVDRPAALLDPRITLFTGTAATGKTTTLMRACLALEADGLHVGWLNQDAELALPRIRERVRESAIDVLAIDDVDAFGAQARPFLVDLIRDNPKLRVLAACRSTRAERIQLLAIPSDVDARNIVVPPLTDTDIDLMIDALHEAGLLGRLNGLTRHDQRQVFSDHCGRQLLVAMIEATSGQRFEDKIEDECRQLLPDQALIYAIVALATRFRTWLSRQEILIASGDSSVERLNHIDALVRQHLIVEQAPDQLVLRHRVIAEHAIGFFRKQHHLGEAVDGLLFVVATRAQSVSSRFSRMFKLMIRLMNHQFLIEEVGDLGEVRGIYERVQPMLGIDFHYWLQRGSLEVKVGDLDLAENYLDQARGLAPGDYRVKTEWAYMSLKRASRDATSGKPGWRERAEEAFADLVEAISGRGANDPYPYHVFGSQGLRYVRRAPLDLQEKERLLDSLRKQVGEATRVHPGVDDLKQLRDDLEKEYLLLSVDDEQPSS